MKKKAILFSVIFFSLTCFLFAGEIGEQLRKKGIHVACLSEEDKINLRMNKLEQAIRQQNIADVVRILSPDYSENDPSFKKNRVDEILDRSFSNFAKNRGFVTKTNKKTGWQVTSTSDFYIQSFETKVEKESAWVKCDIGFSFTSNNIKEKEVLKFSKTGSSWLLVKSDSFFGFIENASTKLEESGAFTEIFGRSPLMSLAEEDYTSTHMFVPTILYTYDGNPIPKMNKTLSYQWFGGSIFCTPYGIVADVQYTPGGPDFTYEFLFITDFMGNDIVASDQDEMLANFGQFGSGLGQFAGPHGICNLQTFYLVADMFNNRVITYRYEKGWDEPMWDFTLTAGFDWPIDVDAKWIQQTEPPEDVTYIAVADYRNHRLALWEWAPGYYPNFDQYYGEYGSGPGQFIYPTSVCFGRDPETGWQTNDLFVTDKGNDRLVRLYVGSEDMFWVTDYQFPVDAELTSVEVDNKGLVYVVDRHNAKVYKFAAYGDYGLELLGIWGERGTADGQLYYPNTLTVAHARYCPYPDPCVPHPYPPGDVFVSESWGDQTGVRRFVIAADIVNLSASYVPYNEDTGEGNFIWYTYHLADFADVTEQVFRGAELCTTYNRGSLNWGLQSGDWNVGSHPHGETYTVKITAGSIYDPTIVVEKTVDVYVDTITTHNPIITRGIRCNHDNPLPFPCDNCYQCIKEGYHYTIDVLAFDPDGYSLSYRWKCRKGYFFDGSYWHQEITTSENYVCYQAPVFYKSVNESTDTFEAFASTSSKRLFGVEPENISVLVKDPYGGEAYTIETFSVYDESTNCRCGDANGDGHVNVTDAVKLINYLFAGLPPPDPLETGDVNNDCEVDILDITCLVNYLFGDGSPPLCCWIH